MILDIHTHGPAPRPEAVIALSPVGFEPIEGQLYSLGFHPWDSGEPVTPEMWDLLDSLLDNPQVVAVGECGVDTLKGAPLFRQMQIFKRHVELSEKHAKPLIIHEVKAHDIITGLRKDLNPSQKWAIHGFRYKPSVAKMMTDLGIYLSFGEKFNAETLAAVPDELLLAETDESTLPIAEIIGRLSEVKGRDIEHLIAHNSSRFLSLEEKSETPS